MNEELKVVGRINVDNPSDPNNHMPARKSDEQVLAEAMGRVEITNKCSLARGSNKCPYMDNHTITCFGKRDTIKCEFSKDIEVIPDLTDPAELWNLLMYMVGREDYNAFDKMLWYKYHGEVINWKEGCLPSDYLKWLFTATYTDKGKEKLMLVKLCADWCREHGKGE